MTNVLVVSQKKTLTNQSFLKIKENQKINHGGDSRYKLFSLRAIFCAPHHDSFLVN